jgi:hypothetical protein
MMERLISKIFKQKEDEPDGGEADIEDFSWRKTILNKEVLYFSTKPALYSASAFAVWTQILITRQECDGGPMA